MNDLELCAWTSFGGKKKIGNRRELVEKLLKSL